MRSRRTARRTARRRRMRRRRRCMDAPRRRVRHAAQGRRLRGCIGHIEAGPAAAARWFRAAPSPPCSDRSALPAGRPPTSCRRCDIELSLLGPLEPIARRRGDRDRPPRPGRRDAAGSAACCCRRSPTEWSWDAETFLAQTCHKAGLPRDAWKHGATVWRFEAEVFGERGRTEVEPERWVGRSGPPACRDSSTSSGSSRRSASASPCPPPSASRAASAGPRNRRSLTRRRNASRPTQPSPMCS